MKKWFSQSRMRKKRNHKFNKSKSENPQPSKEQKPLDEQEMALNKYVAKSGLCSRRKAVEYIEKGLLKVNGEVVTVPYHRVMPGDVVLFKDEQRLKPEENKVYFLFNKPKNVITSASDPEGRTTVLDIMSNACSERIFPVGRLDRNTTGLLLLTNDGDLAKKLSHPSHNVKKLYHITLDKPVEQSHIDIIKKGIKFEEGIAEVDAIDYIKGGKKFEIGIEVHIGWNRIVRRLFEHFGYEVKRLDRVIYAGLTKKDIPRGRWRALEREEIVYLKHFS